MRKKLITTIGGSLVLAVVALVLVTGIAKTQPSHQLRAAEGGAGSTPETGPVLAVLTTTPTQRTLTRALKMPAMLTADETVDLFAKVSGYIKSVKVDIGSEVRKGEPLIEIDVPEMLDELRHAQSLVDAKRAGLEAARSQARQAALAIDAARAEVQRYTAQRELAQVTFDRKEELRAGNAIPEQELDEAKSRLAIAKAQTAIADAKTASAEGAQQAAEAVVQVAAAELAVAEATVARLETLMQYATVRAPFDGVVTARHVDHGAFVRSATEGEARSLLTVVKVDRIRLVLEISESDVASIAIGTAVQVQIKALGDAPFDTAVTRVAGAIKPETGTMRVEVDLDNQAGRLMPGMYALVTVKLEVKQAAMMIPSKAVRIRGKERFVLVAEGGVVDRQVVEIGYDDGIWAEVLSNLRADAQVITAASNLIAPGAPIRAVAETPAGS